MSVLRRLCCVCGAGFLLGAAGILHTANTTVLSDSQAGDINSFPEPILSAVHVSSSTAAEKDAAGYAKKVRSCAAENPDSIGWLRVPGTDIDSIVLRNPPDRDNAYYLSLDFDGKYDRDGSFCTDFRAGFGTGHRWELSRNTTIYGHSWGDDPEGSLFSPLKHYRNPEFARANPYIYFSTAAENMVWEVFAVFDATVDLPYITPDLSDSNFYHMLDIVLDLSLYSYDCAIGPDDRILTLSTCTYSVKGHDALPSPNNYRFAIMAKLMEPGADLRREAVFAINDPILPDSIAGYFS